MARWEPDARGRLRAAAMELFVDRGYEAVTVADIAERAGVTSRTFFRHFADKPEVLFDGGDGFRAHVAGALAAVPADAAPLAAVADALAATGEWLPDVTWSRDRWQVIASHPELRERELIKMASLAETLADGLRTRGVPEPEAALAAETGVAVYRVAFERWVTGADRRALADVVHDAFAGLTALTARG